MGFSFRNGVQAVLWAGGSGDTIDDKAGVLSLEVAAGSRQSDVGKLDEISGKLDKQDNLARFSSLPFSSLLWLIWMKLAF